jgi:hypothetical protein
MRLRFGSDGAAVTQMGGTCRVNSNGEVAAVPAEAQLDLCRAGVSVWLCRCRGELNLSWADKHSVLRLSIEVPSIARKGRMRSSAREGDNSDTHQSTKVHRLVWWR